MPLVQTSKPVIEPIDLDEAKLHLRVIDTVDDTLITMLIGAARRYAESYTGRSFINQGWRLTLDCFPGQMMQTTPAGGYSHPGNAILLERAPVSTVNSIVYLDMGGTKQTINLPGLPDYAIDLTGHVPRITPGFGRVWPIALPQIGAVQVNYIAGYGPTAADVPEGIRHWMLMRIGSLYENREEVAIMSRGKIEALPFADSLLDPYRVVML